MAFSRDVRLDKKFAVQPEIRLRIEVPQSTGSEECRDDVPRGVGVEGGHIPFTVHAQTRGLVQSIYDKKGVNLEQIATKIKPSFFYSEKALE